MQLLGAIQIEIGLVDGDLFNDGAPSAEYLHHLARDIAVAIVARWDENEARTTRVRNVHRGCGANAECACLIRGGADYATRPFAVSNSNRLTGERRIVANLDRREERVEVDV